MKATAATKQHTYIVHSSSSSSKHWQEEVSKAALVHLLIQSSTSITTPHSLPHSILFVLPRPSVGCLTRPVGISRYTIMDYIEWRGHLYHPLIKEQATVYKCTTGVQYGLGQKASVAALTLG